MSIPPQRLAKAIWASGVKSPCPRNSATPVGVDRLLDRVERVALRFGQAYPGNLDPRIWGPAAPSPSPLSRAIGCFMPRILRESGAESRFPVRTRLAIAGGALLGRAPTFAGATLVRPARRHGSHRFFFRTREDLKRVDISAGIQASLAGRYASALFDLASENGTVTAGRIGPREGRGCARRIGRIRRRYHQSQDIAWRRAEGIVARVRHSRRIGADAELPRRAGAEPPPVAIAGRDSRPSARSPPPSAAKSPPK